MNEDNYIHHWINKLYGGKWWIFEEQYRKAIEKDLAIDILLINTGEHKFIPEDRILIDFEKDAYPMPDGNWIYKLKDNNKLFKT